jgi:hypothetical protein
VVAGTAVGRGRLALLALTWAGLTAMGSPGAFAQFPGMARGFPGMAPGTRSVGNAASVPLRCWPERPVSKAGGPVKIHVAFVNTSKAPVWIDVLFYPVPESEAGTMTPPLKISVYNTITHFFPYYMSPAVRPSSTRPVLTKLRPGASVGGSFDLTKFYRLPPGTYNVTVWYSDQMGPSRVGKQSVITRNFITSTVLVKSVNFRVVP